MASPNIYPGQTRPKTDPIDNPQVYKDWNELHEMRNHIKAGRTTADAIFRYKARQQMEAQVANKVQVRDLLKLRYPKAESFLNTLHNPSLCIAGVCSALAGAGEPMNSPNTDGIITGNQTFDEKAEANGYAKLKDINGMRSGDVVQVTGRDEPGAAYAGHALMFHSYRYDNVYDPKTKQFVKKIVGARMMENHSNGDQLFTNIMDRNHQKLIPGEELNKDHNWEDFNDMFKRGKNLPADGSQLGAQVWTKQSNYSTPDPIVREKQLTNSQSALNSALPSSHDARSWFPQTLDTQEQAVAKGRGLETPAGLKLDLAGF